MFDRLYQLAVSYDEHQRIFVALLLHHQVDFVYHNKLQYYRIFWRNRDDCVDVPWLKWQVLFHKTLLPIVTTGRCWESKESVRRRLGNKFTMHRVHKRCRCKRENALRAHQGRHQTCRSFVTYFSSCVRARIWLEKVHLLSSINIATLSLCERNKMIPVRYGREVYLGIQNCDIWSKRNQMCECKERAPSTRVCCAEWNSWESYKK